jgi:hypothetical protein
MIMIIFVCLLIIFITQYESHMGVETSHMILIHIHMIMGAWSHALCEEGLQSDGGGGRRGREGEGERGGVGGGRE